MIRLNLLTWNPLERDCKVLEKMEWYETMMKYGFKPDETEAQLADDPDIRLVPSIMEKIILPKITGMKRTQFQANELRIKSKISSKLVTYSICLFVFSQNRVN